MTGMTTPRSFAIRGRPLLPFVRMGVGGSARRLPGAPTGTIASIDLRHAQAASSFSRAIRPVRELINALITGKKCGSVFHEPEAA